MRLARRAALVAALVATTVATGASEAGSDEVVSPRVVGDAIPEPLAPYAGDAARGRAIVLDRRSGNCLICHRVPVPEEPFQGELSPDLTGVGARLTAGQIRLRLVDQARLNPETIMPPYHRIEGLRRVAEAFRGKPVLTATEIEDVVAWLVTLREQRKDRGAAP
jgi:sulfur-oxidizing protein SoxX